MVINPNTRVRIEYPVAGTDPVYQTPTVVWTLLGMAWAEMVDKLPARDEALLNAISLSSVRTRIRMRYRTDVDASMRFIIMRPTETVWAIVGGPAMLGNKEHVEFLCERKST